MQDYLKANLGMTDEDVARVSPNIVKAFVNGPRLAGKKIVATCVKSQYCIARIKEGARVVFDGSVIIQEETTAPLCLRGIACLVTLTTQLVDRMLNGLPEEVAFPRIPCMDPGLDAGGLGTVVWEISVE